MIRGTPIVGKLRLELAVFLELIVFQTSRHIKKPYSIIFQAERSNESYSKNPQSAHPIIEQVPKILEKSDVSKKITQKKNCSRVFACNLTRKCRRSSIYCTHLFPQGFRHGFHPEMANIRHGGELSTDRKW